VILVDTSVWVDHLRRGNPRLAALLAEGQVLCHPFVVGELACGRLTRRREVLSLFDALPQAPEIAHREALAFVDHHGLSGTGVGWVDVHLLAAASLARGALWTLDRALARVAARLALA
jgi:hypothetical protein